MACTLTQDITKGCRDSVGGIKTIYLAELSRKGSVTQASGVITAWTMSSGSFWTYELEMGVASYTQTIKPNRTNGTTYYEQSITFTIPKTQATLSQEFKLLAQNDLMVIALDRNGKYFLLGEANGLSMADSTNETGTAMADFNGYRITLTGSEETIAPEVQSGVVATII